MSIYRVVVCMGCVVWCILASAASAQIKLASFEAERSKELTPRVTRVENYTEPDHVMIGEVAQTSFFVEVHHVPFAKGEVKNVTVVYPQLRLTFYEPDEPPVVFGIKHYDRGGVPEKIKNVRSNAFVFLLVLPF